MKDIQISSSFLLLLGTLLASLGYGATFLLSDYIKICGGASDDVGFAFASAMIGTFVGVPCVGWLASKLNAIRLASIACLSISFGFLLLSSASYSVFILVNIAGFFIGLGWGMFYVGAPMGLSERISDQVRGLWFTRFGAFQMAGIGISPVVIHFLNTKLHISLQICFLALALLVAGASLLLKIFNDKEPVTLKNHITHAWVTKLPKILRSVTVLPILMVCFGACAFSGLMSFQSSLVAGSSANPSMFFMVYAITTVFSRIICAPFLTKIKPITLMFCLLTVMLIGIFAMFGVQSSALWQIISAICVGAGYGLVYPIIQTWAINSSDEQDRHAVFTWFVLFYFVGVFGFPAVGSFLLKVGGSNMLLITLVIVVALEISCVIYGALRYKNIKG